MRGSLQDLDGEEDTARNRKLNVDEATRSLSYSMVENLREATFTNSVYSLHDACKELEKFCYYWGCHPLAFTTLKEVVTKALTIVGPQSPRVGKTELDLDGNLSIRVDLQPASTPCFEHRSLSFSVAWWVKIKLRAKQRSSKWIDTIYVSNTLKMKKPGSFGLEIRVNADIYDRTEEGNVDDSELDASSSLCKEGD